MTDAKQTTLGDLISTLYDEYMEIYGDEDLAAVATAATINDIIGEASAPSRGDPRMAEADAA